VKKLIVRVVILLAVLLVAGCAGMTASLWDGRDGATGGRVGYDMNDSEVGLSVLYSGDADEIYGAYGMYKMPNAVEIPNPVAVEWLPEILMGTPYIGVTIEVDGDNSALMAGVEIGNALFMEYQDNYVLIGLKRKF